jgi:hypothetical protein
MISDATAHITSIMPIRTFRVVAASFFSNPGVEIKQRKATSAVKSNTVKFNPLPMNFKIASNVS